MVTPKSFTFHAPTQLVVGPDSFARLPELAQNLGSKAIIVTDKMVAAHLGLTDKVNDFLTQVAIPSVVFDDIEPNPDLQSVSKGADLARDQQADLIIAIGGGSVLDAAKGIAIVASHGKDIWYYIGGDLVPGPVAKIITIPTTSGTGSETTPFAVFTKKDEHNKQGLYSPHIFPAVSILDPVITKTMPTTLTASTGLDALAHAVEAYTSKAANPISDALAEKAIELIAAALPTAVENGSDLAARQALALASALAGMSITHAGVTAAHGFSMSIGGLFDQPHGLTTGILLPPIIAYNEKAIAEKSARIAAIFASSNPQHFANQTCASEVLKRILNIVNVPDKLSAIGLSENDIVPIVDDCLERGDFENNTVSFTREQAITFLQKMIG